MALDPKFAEQLTASITKVNARKADRHLLLEEAVRSVDHKTVAYLIAHEIQAESELEQLMVKFGDMADMWARHNDYSKVQDFAEAEFECKRVLDCSEKLALIQQYKRVKATSVETATES